jgi:hypothetical protein
VQKLAWLFYTSGASVFDVHWIFFTIEVFTTSGHVDIREKEIY